MNSCGYCFLPYPNEKHLPTKKGEVLMYNTINVLELVLYWIMMLKSPS